MFNHGLSHGSSGHMMEYHVAIRDYFPRRLISHRRMVRLPRPHGQQGQLCPCDVLHDGWIPGKARDLAVLGANLQG